MKFRHLLIGSLFAANMTHGQVSLTAPRGISELQTAVAATDINSFTSAELPGLAKEIPVAPLPYQSDGLGVYKVAFFMNLGIGYNVGSVSYPNVSTKGGGMKYFGDLGVKIPFGDNNNSATNRFFSVSLGLSGNKVKDNYKDKGPAGSNNNEYVITSYALPVSYTNVAYRFADDRGYYWQAGAMLNYVGELDVNGAKMKDHINNFGFEPFVGFGFAWIGDYHLRHSSGLTTVNGLIGPFVSYSVTNPIGITGQSLRYFSFGITLTEVFL